MATLLVSPEEFARRVRQLREFEELSQEQLAIRSQGRLKRSWLSRLELGHIRRPSYEKLHALADALGCEVEDLISPPGQKPNPDVLRDALIAEARTLAPEDLDLALSLLRTLRERERDRGSR